MQGIHDKPKQLLLNALGSAVERVKKLIGFDHWTSSSASRSMDLFWSTLSYKMIWQNVITSDQTN